MSHLFVTSNLLRSLPADKLFIETYVVPEAERLDFWRDAMRAHYQLELDADPEMPIAACAEKLQIGRSAITTMTVSQSRYSSLAECRDQNQDLIFFIMKQGCIQIAQRGQDVRIGPGQAAALLGVEPYKLEMIGEDSTFSILRMPVSPIALAVPNLDQAIVRPLESQAHAIALLHGYMKSLMALETQMGPEASKTVTDHLSDLLSFALNSAVPIKKKKHGGGIRAARRHAVKKEIAANLAKHGLSSEDVAARLGITARYLRKLLEDEGTSFSGLVRHMRIHQAHKLLSDPANLAVPISTIAYRVGFVDLSYFNYCFREEFGMKPSDIRDMAIQKLDTVAAE